MCCFNLIGCCEPSSLYPINIYQRLWLQQHDIIVLKYTPMAAVIAISQYIIISTRIKAELQKVHRVVIKFCRVVSFDNLFDMFQFCSVAASPI